MKLFFVQLLLSLIAFSVFGQSNADDVCSLPPTQTGKCMALFKKWTLDGGCKQFIYGGCGANRNMFDSREDCEKACGQSSAVDVCSLPPAQNGANGRICMAYMPSWTFDQSKGGCTSFVYGGCGGNKNRFRSQGDCEKACGQSSAVDVCSLPPAQNGADGRVCMAYMPSWTFDQSKGGCRSFVYGGCGGNKNRFTSQGDCEKACGQSSAVDVCSLPPAQAGMCRAYIPSWTFDQSKGGCREFGYGGCQGNKNRFKSKGDCEKACGQSSAVDVCSLPPAQNGMNGMSCMAYMPSWTFDRSKGGCRSFVYGGCGGNKNRFGSQGDCEKACGKK